ncbi:glycoside hydrolase family 3 C-terminal domain-containing protein [Lentzea sp.]|uniref:glycoside hydrolase family 3 C-terminal domain-containing protein n=1 Tax=Lentzea sp. TaxID=56099 RepID=UPI002C3B6C2E|nr:glycoside hydrolase family 3 C-terminal domain-containing protein [Lentzea sp.]HUQ54178.1 glycoside hydrolase family 3 C-terminal domain-containing protein [Lentzea sp.]
MRSFRIAAIAVLLSGAVSAATATTTTATAAAQPQTSLEQRVNGLLQQMTVDEQVTLLRGISAPLGHHEVGYVAGVPRLGIPPLRLTDGPAGVRDQQPATAFPAPVAVAASFDRDLAHQAGELMGKETKARGYHVLYAPMVNIVRVPQAGRNFETYGEDPYLAGQLSTSFVAGLQGQGVAAQVKHYAVNNQENARTWASSNVDDRTLREIYLPAFEMAVKQGGSWSAMCAYNLVNRSYACENFPLLNDILNDQWGFSGVVGSDYPATHSGVKSALAGLDQEFGGSTFYAGLPGAVGSGELTKSVLDERTRRVLRMLLRTGALDSSPAPSFSPAEHAAAARKQASAGTVLLKNDNGVLPLPGSTTKVALSGIYGDVAHTGGDGSSRVTPYPEHTVKPVDALRAKLGNGLTYHVGARIEPFPVPAGVLTGLRADFYNNRGLSGTPAVSRSDSVIDFNWLTGSPAPGVNADNWSARWVGTLTAPVTGTYRFALTSDDGSSLYIDGRQVVDNWGDHGTETRWGSVDLQAGVPHQVVVDYSEAAGFANLSLDWYAPGAADPEIAAAAEAARAAEVAVVIVGDRTTEGADRTDIDLPGNQNELVKAIAAANPRTVVVLETGGPVTMPWLSSVSTLMEAWYPGEQNGNALVDLLWGAEEPAGRLPMTFPVNLDSDPMQSPEQYPGAAGSYEYSEGLFVGYRWYDASGVAPMFPFGHGLGYTTFTYSGLSLTQADGAVTVSFTVRNTGSRRGSAVPQVYVGYPGGAGEPPRQLRDFAKVTLDPGATTRVAMTLDRRAFALWDTGERTFRVPNGTFTVSVGASSRDMRLSGTAAQQAFRIPNGATGQLTSNYGACMDVASANSANGTPIGLWSCNGTGAQRWTAAPDGTIRALGKCLAVQGDQAVLADCSGQRWTAEPNGALVAGDRCLTAGGQLFLSPCNGSAGQAWVLPRPADRLQGIAGRCVDVDGGHTWPGTAIWIYDCNGTGAQDWKLDADGSLRALGRCMDVKNGWTDPGTAVQLWDCNGTPAQQWRVQNGSLVNVKSGQCLDVRNGWSDNLTPLQIWWCNGSAAQNWRIPRR